MKEKRGEHPFGDLGQLMLAALFLAVWVGGFVFSSLVDFFEKLGS